MAHLLIDRIPKNVFPGRRAFSPSVKMRQANALSLAVTASSRREAAPALPNFNHRKINAQKTALGHDGAAESRGARGCNLGGDPKMTLDIITIQPIVALVAGILILIAPRLLNYVVAIYLIIVGVTGLWGHMG